MKCKEIKYYLNDYANGFLIDEMRNEIRNHLDNCRECRTYYIDEISILREVVPLPKELSSSGDITDEISAVFPKRKRRKSAKILSINKTDTYPNFGSRKLIVKKRIKSSNWFTLGAVFIAIVLGVMLGILYFFQ